MATSISSSFRKYLPHLTAFLIIVTGVIAIEFAMGRIAFCSCGEIKFWYGLTNGPGNSQHITDWYSFSHFIHGLLFYGFLHLVSKWLGRKKAARGEKTEAEGHAWSLATRLILAVLMEAAWEILENSPLVINRYRSVTLANDYEGDSILNSVIDIVTCAAGFLVARKLPVWLTVTLIITLEVFAAYFVRDNLTLNVVMLLFPIDAVKAWQAAL